MANGIVARQDIYLDSTGVYSDSTYGAVSAPSTTTSGVSVSSGATTDASGGLTSTFSVITNASVTYYSNGTGSSTAGSTTVAGYIGRLHTEVAPDGEYPNELSYSVLALSPTTNTSGVSVSTGSTTDASGTLTSTFATVTGVTAGTGDTSTTYTPIITTVALSGNGIASDAAFGTATLTTSQNIYPTGVASSAAFGTANVTASAQTISPSGIATSEAFGTAFMSMGGVTIFPAAIGEDDAFGTAELTGGAPRIYPTGLSDSEVGNPLLVPGYGVNAIITLLPSISSRTGLVLRDTVTLTASATGTLNRDDTQTITPVGIDVTQPESYNFGLPILTLTTVSTVDAIALTEADHTIVALSGAAVAVDEPDHSLVVQAETRAFGVVDLTESDHTLQAVFIASGEAIADLYEPDHTIDAVGLTYAIASIDLTEPDHTLAVELLSWSLSTVILVDDGDITLNAVGAAIVQLDDSSEPIIISQAITVTQVIVNLDEPPHTLSVVTEFPSFATVSLTEPDHYLTHSYAELDEPAHAIQALFVSAVTAISEALVMNANNRETTRWTNQPFTQVVRFNGGHVGLSPNGLYEFTGTTDDGTTITSTVRTHENGFGSFHLSRVPYLYINELMSATVKPILDGVQTGTYKTEGKRRVHLARGPKGRKWAFEFSSTDSNFQLDYLEVLGEGVSRKV